MSTFDVIFDANGRVTDDLPLDRTTHERLVRTVLAWNDPAARNTADYRQIGELLSGAGQAVADDVRRCTARLARDDGKRLFAEIVLREAAGRLPVTSTTLHSLHNKARLLRALYERLDRLEEAAPGQAGGASD